MDERDPDRADLLIDVCYCRLLASVRRLSPHGIEAVFA